jgi:hypothetical protein
MSRIKKLNDKIHIEISKTNRKKLGKLKIDLDKKSYNDVITELLKDVPA